MSTLYDELGVSRQASLNELRRAYRERARLVHPDVNPGSGSEEAIRRLNEIWAVLGNPAERRRYDATLGSAPPAVVRIGRVQPRLPAPPSRAERVLRPSVFVLAVLGIIFVVTAYAGPHSSDHKLPNQRPPSSVITSPAVTSTPLVSALVGRCLLIQTGYDAVTPCSQPNSGEVVAEVAQLSQCPAGSVGYQLEGRAQLVCLAPSR